PTSPPRPAAHPFPPSGKTSKASVDRSEPRRLTRPRSAGPALRTLVMPVRPLLDALRVAQAQPVQHLAGVLAEGGDVAEAVLPAGRHPRRQHRPDRAGLGAG